MLPASGGFPCQRSCMNAYTVTNKKCYFYKTHVNKNFLTFNTKRYNSLLSLFKRGRGMQTNLSNRGRTGSPFAKLSEEIDTYKAFPRFNYSIFDTLHTRRLMFAPAVFQDACARLENPSPQDREIEKNVYFT